MAGSEALLFFLSNLMCISFPIISGAGNERRLLNNLLEEYQKYERPVANEFDPVSLNFTLSLQQIIDLDERNQILITNLWLDYTWQDVNLAWNKVYINLS
jgi:nicotinic acetylcholine receptor